MPHLWQWFHRASVSYARNLLNPMFNVQFFIVRELEVVNLIAADDRNKILNNKGSNHQTPDCEVAIDIF